MYYNSKYSFKQGKSFVNHGYPFVMNHWKFFQKTSFYFLTINILVFLFWFMMIFVLEILFSRRGGGNHTYLIDFSESRLKERCLTLLGSGGEFFKVPALAYRCFLYTMWFIYIFRPYTLMLKTLSRICRFVLMVLTIILLLLLRWNALIADIRHWMLHKLKLNRWVKLRQKYWILT